jgi:peptidyl-prolyl cis-trans isomerase C
LKIATDFRLVMKALIGGILPPIIVLSSAGCERREVGSRQDAGPPVARVNGEALPRAEFETYLPDDYRRTLTASEIREYLDRWVTTQILYDAAMASGAGVTPEIEARLDQFKKGLVADRFVQKIISERAVVSEAEARAYYDAHVDEYTRELRVSHILVNTMEDANQVAEQLKTHTFAWVAQRYSIDKHTGVGGDLGFLSKGNMIPEFENVVFDMKIGEVSDVIESELGYHFVKITDAREARNKLEYEEVAEDISRILLLAKRDAVYDSLITTLRGESRIEILDPDLRMALESISDSDSVYESGFKR